MKDSKEMWAVSSDLTYGKVNALYDIEDNKATHYAFDGSTAYSEVDERSVKLFNTEAEAKNYIEEHIEYLKSKDQEIYNLLREMEYIKNNNCEREIQFSIFSRLELFYRNAQKDKWEEKYYHLDGKYVRLLQILITGYLNIGGYTFKKEDVRRIEWCMYGENRKRYMNLILKDDKVIKVEEEEDIDLLKVVFGENKSGKVYVNNDNNYRGYC